ncbi:ATP-binding protein [Bhargavaea ullalensis]|uniref:histidine kinase n=1 Tax=Bhargavaea ullalensis TaxID=1265685 RepID=A0ABV2G8F9_9BACL
MKKLPEQLQSCLQKGTDGLQYFMIDINKDRYWFVMPDGELYTESTTGLKGMSLDEFMHRDDLPLVRKRLVEAAAGKPFSPFTFRMVEKGWDPYYVRELVCMKDGKFLVGLHPITLNPRGIAAQEKLSVWSSPFFELMEEAAILTLTDGTVINVNNSFVELFGWSAAELLGKPVPIVPEELNHEFKVGRMRLISGERIYRVDSVRLRKDGSRLPVHIQAYPVYDEEGRVSAFFVLFISRDALMSSRSLIHLQERIIRDRDQLILDIMNNVDLGIAQYDCIHGNFIYLNPAMGKLFGLPLNDIYADPRSLCRNMLPEDHEAVKSFLRGLKNVSSEIEFRILDAEEEIKWVRTKFIRAEDDGGETVRLIGFTQDITELKRSEQLTQKWEKLGVVGRLAAGIAHEVRNPLTSVKGFIQLMGEGSDSPFTEVILDELGRIELIMDEFLMLAKPHQETEMIDHDLNDVLYEVTRLLQAEAHMYGCKIRFRRTKKAAIVPCEAKQIKQVVINIVKNAIEAMPDGGIIRVSLTSDEDTATIRIKDEGVGIPADRIHRLGEPFYSNKEKGTGLGLMTSYKIIENHGGTIRFSSTEGEGTTVSIELPVLSAKL